jgi:predicted N-acyltransferase
MFCAGKELIGVLPGGLTDNNEVFWSPVGASYGSLVTKDISFETALNLVDSMIEYFKKKNIREFYLIPPPFFYYHNYSQNIEYAMLYRKFDFELHYISHAIDLKHKENFLDYFDKTARKSIHKIFRENLLQIRESDDYESFNQILIENKARHNVKPTHTLEDMLTLKKLLPENIKLLLVYYEDKPIAGSLLFICNSKVVLCFYNMLKYEYEYLKPVYLIMYETVRWAMENGYEWVDIGVSQDTSVEDPMTPSMNLIYFKERFDSHGILRSTFHYKF